MAQTEYEEVAWGDRTEEVEGYGDLGDGLLRNGSGRGVVEDSHVLCRGCVRGCGVGVSVGVYEGAED